MIKYIKMLVWSGIQKFYRRVGKYCCYKSKIYGDKGEHGKSVRWLKRASRYFIKQCDAALKVVELAS